MEKIRLKAMRVSKGFTQEDVAKFLATDKANYCKKEKGIVKIHKQEWDKLATFLSCDVDEIFEKENTNIFINSQNALGDNCIYNAYNELAQETMRKYITKLEDENTSYKMELSSLKEEITILKKLIERNKTSL